MMRPVCLALHLDCLDGVFPFVFTAAPAAAAFVPLGLLRRLALSPAAASSGSRSFFSFFSPSSRTWLLVGARIVVRASLLPILCAHG